MEHERIVVGVDGSRYSLRAVRWALGEAWHRRADVELVGCWHVPYIPDGYAMAAITPDDMSAEARRHVEDARAEYRREIELLAQEDLHVECRLAEGPASPTLEGESKGADLLVVGRRGRGPLRRLLLGSVSRHVAAHASCPVVVVPDV
jgi:nucleotide-binding universal stress UspA family protein